MKNDLLNFIEHEQAREDGPICQRCDSYFAMTGIFKDATEEEFKIAKRSVWFASTMLKFWEKDKKIDYDKDEDQSRPWEGTEFIRKWCRQNMEKGKIRFIE